MSIDDLLEPISPEQPAGEDLSGTAGWAAIAEARRRGSPSSLGLAGLAPEAPDWRLVEQFTRTALQEQSKDIRLAIWWLEAQLHLNAIVGLCDGLRLLHRLLEQFWDLGLHPNEHPNEDPEMRAGMLEWLNEKLADALFRMVLVKVDGQNYTYGRLLDLNAVERGREAMPAAIAARASTAFAPVVEGVSEARGWLREIQGWLDARLVDGPVFSASSSRLDDMYAHAKKWRDGPERGPTEEPVPVSAVAAPVPVPAASGEQAAGGRARFLLHLELAANCVREGKLPAARGILTALGEQSDRLGLEQWESPDLLAQVWRLLHTACAGGNPGSEEAALRAKAFRALCRIVPREAMDLGGE